MNSKDGSETRKAKARKEECEKSFKRLIEFYKNEQQSSSEPASSSTLTSSESVDYENNDYRGFCFLIHPKHGLLMLQCSKNKKNKPSPHFQVPGGHVDDFEFEDFQEQTEEQRDKIETLRPGSLSERKIIKGNLTDRMKP